MRPFHIVITCEHAGNQVPKAYEYLFQLNKEILKTHKAYDIGAMELACYLSDEVRARLFETQITRLLVDTNRSLHNRELYSEFSSKLSSSVRQYLVDTYYTPYRKKVEQYIHSHQKRQPVCQFSIHTFTPFWHSQERLVDIGVLFDESRSLENAISTKLVSRIQELLPRRTVMKNVPYRGTDDGFTTYLRSLYSEQHYIGIELEVNQKWADTPEFSKIKQALALAIRETTDSFRFSADTTRAVE